MQKYGIPAFYFPTTAVFVDDSNDFLMNFSLQLDPKLAYQLYSSPYLALQFLQQQRMSRLNQRCFSQYAEAIAAPSTTQTINLDLSSVHREVYDPLRFREVSVVVVDYSMPDMNGLELCKRLKDKPVKKILLTGQADAQTAIDAFNQGIIDHFIMKSDPRVIDKVSAAIHDLQYRYFQDMSELMVKVLSIDSLNYLQDKEFVNTFNQVCKKHEIVEHYLTQNSGAFLMLNGQGVAKWFVLNTQTDLTMYEEIAADLGVDAEIINKIKSGKYCLHFWSPDHYHDIDPIEWESYLYPAKQIEGEEVYHYAVVDNPTISNLDVDGIYSYHQYLEQIDNTVEEPIALA